MKKYILFLINVLVFSNLFAQTNTTWNGKDCAVVLTYDDGLNVDLTNVIPALDSVGLKGTFYISDYFALTQRPFAKHDQNIPAIATTKMDVSKMKDEDIAGIAVFQDPYAYIGIKENNGKTIDSAVVNTSTIYLRTLASNATKRATFEYSTDDKNFKALGEASEMKFSLKIFTGNKSCLFNYATKEPGGYVDVDWFRVK